MLLAIAALCLSVLTGAAADVTGTWEGKITAERPDGTTADDAALLILQQKGSTVSGTVGGSETDRHPITSGTIEGNKLTLQAKNANNERTYKVELTISGDEMKGTLTSGDRVASLAVKRKKP
jgi:hypothetical protein